MFLQIHTFINAIEKITSMMNNYFTYQTYLYIFTSKYIQINYNTIL